MKYILYLNAKYCKFNPNKSLCATTYFHPHFTDEETVTQRSDLSKVTHFQKIRNNYLENEIFTHISSNAVIKLPFYIY